MAARDMASGVMFRPTLEFRWFRKKPLPNEHWRQHVLQQAWLGENGQIDWRDVPLVDEE